MLMERTGMRCIRTPQPLGEDGVVAACGLCVSLLKFPFQLFFKGMFNLSFPANLSMTHFTLG